jgi:two-component system response regulator NreC
MAALKPKIRVVIADDHAILRSGLKLLVNSQDDMEVVAEAADGKQAVERTRETAPDVALLDLSMPQNGGMEALQKIIERGAKTRVVVLTMYDDPAYLRSALASGASGYVLKRSVDGDLLSAIRAVHRGGVFVDPSLAKVLVQDVVANNRAKNGQSRPPQLLSDRELQVLRLVARGFSSKQIAGQIFVSAKTVETYRARLLEKLNLRTRSDLVRYAVHMGLLNAEDVDK